jgi:flagellar secretion chaperone FliS
MHQRQDKYAQYSNTDVTTANRLRLLVMLYDGAIRFVDIAKARIETGNVAEKGLYIGKALSIVGEFKNTLDFNVAGDLPKQLERLYVFVEDRLIQANVKNDPSKLDDARRILETLRSGWVELEKRGVANDPALQQGSAQGNRNPDNFVKINV